MYKNRKKNLLLKLKTQENIIPTLNYREGNEEKSAKKRGTSICLSLYSAVGMLWPKPQLNNILLLLTVGVLNVDSALHSLTLSD
jgi:hypothetical protein